MNTFIREDRRAGRPVQPWPGETGDPGSARTFIINLNHSLGLGTQVCFTILTICSMAILLAGSDGTQITLSQSDKWLRQAKVIDGWNITTTDTAIAFRCKHYCQT